jgi:Glycogen recognition site of AMP-activated protein kinase
MEMSSNFLGINWSRQLRCLLFCFLLFAAGQLLAQNPGNRYTVRQGRMYIEMSKQQKDEDLDRFISQYDLAHLALKQFVKNNISDSLKRAGWKIESNNSALCVISKSLNSLEDINSPAKRITLTDSARSGDFPTISNRLAFGYNRFVNKSAFAVKDSVVRFFLRNHLNARKAVLAGSFNNFNPDALQMKRTDSGWIATVKMSPGKYLYKFVIDGNWTIDSDNRTNENDGRGNTNSVYYQPNTLFKTSAFNNARRVYVAGSFNNWQSGQLVMIKTSDGWELPLYLSQGTHTYRYVVDGQWHADPSNPDKFPNEFSEYNSVKRIGKPYLFSLKGYDQAKDVKLIGSFNNWRRYELPMTQTKAGWQLVYTLGPGNYEFKFLVDGKVVSDPANQSVSGGNGVLSGSYLVLGPNYTFRLKGFTNAKTVFLAGDFNNWNPRSLMMRREKDEWIFTVHLYPGKHVYKFIVDGRWILDPANRLWEQNEYDTGNSVLWVE